MDTDKEQVTQEIIDMERESIRDEEDAFNDWKDRNKRDLKIGLTVLGSLLAILVAVIIVIF